MDLFEGKEQRTPCEQGIAHSGRADLSPVPPWAS
jgi:hypothetical protein